MLFWEVLVDEGEELSTNVGLDVSAVRGVEPCYVPFSLLLLFFAGVSVLGCVGEVGLVASFS